MASSRIALDDAAYARFAEAGAVHWSDHAKVQLRKAIQEAVNVLAHSKAWSEGAVAARLKRIRRVIGGPLLWHRPIEAASRSFRRTLDVGRFLRTLAT